MKAKIEKRNAKRETKYEKKIINNSYLVNLSFSINIIQSDTPRKSSFGYFIITLPFPVKFT